MPHTRNRVVWCSSALAEFPPGVTVPQKAQCGDGRADAEHPHARDEIVPDLLLGREARAVLGRRVTGVASGDGIGACDGHAAEADQSHETCEHADHGREASAILQPLLSQLREARLATVTGRHDGHRCGHYESPVLSKVAYYSDDGWCVRA